MPVAETAKTILSLDELSFPVSLPVTRLEVEDYIDHSGDDSLRVLAVLDESVDVDAIDGRAVGDLKQAIRDRLRERGIDRFVYIFLAKQSELDEPDETE